MYPPVFDQPIKGHCCETTSCICETFKNRLLNFLVGSLVVAVCATLVVGPFILLLGLLL